MPERVDTVHFVQPFWPAWKQPNAARVQEMWREIPNLPHVDDIPDAWIGKNIPLMGTDPASWGYIQSTKGHPEYGPPYLTIQRTPPGTLSSDFPDVPPDVPEYDYTISMPSYFEVVTHGGFFNSLGHFFTSPMGIATLALGALTAGAGLAADAGLFAAEAAEAGGVALDAGAGLEAGGVALDAGASSSIVDLGTTSLATDSTIGSSVADLSVAGTSTTIGGDLTAGGLDFAASSTALNVSDALEAAKLAKTGVSLGQTVQRLVSPAPTPTLGSLYDLSARTQPVTMVARPVSNELAQDDPRYFPMPNITPPLPATDAPGAPSQLAPVAAVVVVLVVALTTLKLARKPHG